MTLYVSSFTSNNNKILFTPYLQSNDTLRVLFSACALFSQVLPSQCRHRGAMLVFTVMDHDLVFQNDFGGEAFLPLADVPGVNGEEVSGFDALHVISLALIHPKVIGMCRFSTHPVRLYSRFFYIFFFLR